MGSGSNKRDLSAIDVLGHSTMVSARLRNLPVQRVKQVLTVLGTFGEIVRNVAKVRKLDEVNFSLVSKAHESALKWANHLENDPVSCCFIFQSALL